MNLSYPRELISKGKYLEAENIYKAYLKKGITSVEIYFDLGRISFEQSKWIEAIPYFNQIILFDENSPLALLHLGLCHKNLGDSLKAISYFEKSIQFEDNFFEAHFYLGIELNRIGLYIDAINSFTKALAIRPESINTLNAIGIAYKNNGDFSSAITYYNRAVQIKPDYYQTFYNLGLLYEQTGSHENAIESFEKVIELQNHFLIALIKIALIQRKKGNCKKAITSFKKALSIKNDSADIIYEIGNTYGLLGDRQQQKNYYERAISLDPEHSISKISLIHSCLSDCDWKNFSKFQTWAKNLGVTGNPVSPWLLMSLCDEPALNLEVARNFYNSKYRRENTRIISLRSDRINIGYFSANFYNHAIMQLIVRLFELHNKDKFRIYAYSFGKCKEDEYRQRVKNSVFKFRDIKELSDIEVRDQAKKDNIHIAVDLVGYMKDSRFPIFSQRIAPIQISYLGYPGTTGSDCIDYILADKELIPLSHSKFYSERILYMPHCYQCNDNTFKISTKEFTRKDFGLPTDGFIFTCFNSNYKITPIEFDIWMRILSRVSNSFLWLNKSSITSKSNLINESIARGIDSNRIYFSDSIPLPLHMARHKCGDLFLDTFNYSAGATAWIALRSGMPLLTLPGDSYTSRMSTSLLSTIGLNELIAKDSSNYEELAVRLATDNEYYQNIKKALAIANKESILYDSLEFTKSLEQHYTSLYNSLFET